ncbi:mucin-4-like isoform X5 [Schistocerca cancellata]|uniref:mucin-4-like isoform X4 n=1 Tax=Schistocerca cancellata TaxID=274614 RepID=UPI002117CAD4|nr:mucin-4-like isoform X4 [Schistocerca cancellata]XP_049768206.1 mucin-4-like isoform X5 [Schistocerca cancellata]
MAPPRALLAIATLCSALVAARAAAPNANCDLLFDGNPVSSSSWSSALNASRYVGDLVDTAEPQAEYLVLTTKEVTAFAVDSPSDYIDVVFDEAASTLKLVVKEEFANYEEQMISASDPSIIDIRITLTCSDTNTAGFGFKITVKDTNNHPPEFDKSSYPFELPMPLPSDIDLSCLVDVIKVTDIDFSNSDITIEFDEDGAKLFRGEATYLGSRNYEIHVYSTTAIELKETTTFTMTAKDNGSPQQSSSPATITINVNQQTSPPTAPTFQPAASHKTVAADEIVPGTEVASVTISEGYGTDVEVTHYTLDEAGVTPTSDAFAVDVTAASDGTATVSLRWAEGVAPESLQDLKYALVVLQATRERDVSTNQVATTVVHLSLPGLQDPPTTACPTPEPCPTTVEPTPCPEPDPCPSTPPPEPCPTTVEPTPCPEPDPCPSTPPPEPCPTTTQPTECPEPQPCPTAAPSSTTEQCPVCPECSSTAEPTNCPTSCPTNPSWPTTPYPECSSSSITEPCICEAPSQCTSAETTSPGSTTDCSQCPTTECPPTSPNTGSPSECTECPECPTICPTCPSTCPDTGSTTDCSQCPTTECPPTSPNTGLPTDATECPECPTICPTCPSTCPDTGSTTDCSQCPTTECPPTSPNTGSPSECTECPECPTICPTCPSTCPDTGSTTDCSQCPTTVCPPTSPNTGLPTDATECPECPTTCPSISTTCPDTGSTTDCSQCPTTECPPTSPNTGSPTDATECPECPTTCPSISTTWPDTGSTTDCSQCPATECPPTSPNTCSPSNATECPECPTTECPPTSPDTGSSTDATECPECPTTCPSISTTGSDTGSTTDCSQCPTTECPPTSPNTGSDSSECPQCPTTCTTCEPCTTAEPTSTTPALPPGPPIEFERSRYRDTVSSVYVGTLANLTLKDYDSEGHTLDCQLLDATDYVASRVSVHPVGVAGCQLTIDAFLRAGSYAFSVRANLAGTSSVATTEVALAVSTTITCDDSTSPIFPIALLVTSQPENQTAAANILPPTELGDGARCSFNHSVDPAEYSDWVQVDKATGEMNVTDLDYESVTSLFISLSVSCESEPEQQQQQQQPRRLRRTKDQPDWPEYLLYDNTSMSVLLQIQDVNDNPPVFTAGDRIVVGYPTGDLLERVQPGPVVTLKATDADEGENAELRYSLDAAGSRHFTVGAETGAVYVRADAPELPDSGVSFTATVADLAGAAGALSDTVVVQVKPLKDEELVLVTTVEGALPEDADAVVEDLCGATGLNVRLLRAYAAAAEEGRALAGGRAARAASGSATTMLLYALDDQEALVTVQQFQTLLSSSEIKVENLPPEAENQEPTDVTGYMAAIITLAVLIAVALGGAVAGYYFYFRPRLGVHKQTDDYTKFESDADKDSPLESQIPQITTTVEPKISTVSEIIEPVNEVTVENNIITDENSNGVLAPDSEDDWSRKRSMTIRGGPDDYNDEEASGEPRRSESSDSLDGDEAHAESERRKSAVHFNENVECIEVERL